MTVKTKKRKKIIILQLAIVLIILSLGVYFGLKYQADMVSNNQTAIMLPVNNERFNYLNNPLIQGKAAPNAVLKIYDNNTEIGQTTSDNLGDFYYKPTGFSNGIHKITVRNSADLSNSSEVYVSFDTSNSDKAILKAQNTQIIENDRPFYANGANDYDAIVKYMGNDQEKSALENDFANAEKAGVKMLRIINYTLDDISLPNPSSAPETSLSTGGILPAGNYVYRYTCANLSKDTFGYNTAQTLPSPATSTISTSSSQSVTLTLKPCAQSYRYYIYRRLVSDPVDSEVLLTGVAGVAGQNATYTDNGISRPVNTWNNPDTAPTLSSESGGSLAANTYVYRYLLAQEIINEDGRWGYLREGSTTAGSPTGQISVASNSKVKITIPPNNLGTIIGVYRRLASDPENSEKWIATVRPSATGETSWYDTGSYTPAPDTGSITQTNQTTSVSLPTVNSTSTNPRTSWPSSKSHAFMTGFGNWNEDSLVAADNIMALAQKYNIRIFFTFIDQHDNNTGGVREIARNCGVSNSDFFSDTCSKNMMKEIISKFLNRTNTVTGKLYKDDPAIFAWELINEPWETNGGGGFRAWEEEMAGYIKNIDSNHMVSSGDDGSIWFTHNHEPAYNFNNNHDFVMMGTPKDIDLLTWHGYPEANGFMFSNGYYGEYKPDPVADADWIAKYGKVVGPIDIDTTIKQLNRHAYYAKLLNKPVVFGEWGVDWNKPGATDWITRLSDAIIHSQSDYDLGPNIFPDPQNSDLGSNWVIKADSPAVSLDNSNQYNAHSSIKLEVTSSLDNAGNKQYSRWLASQKFLVKPNTSYWYEFIGKNPSSKSASISIGSYYKDGVWVSNGNWGEGGPIWPSSQWTKINRFDNGMAEFTTPSGVNQMDISIGFASGTEGDTFNVGEIRIYEIVDSTTTSKTTFSASGWWGIPDNNYSNNEALRIAAVKFAELSITELPALSPDKITLSSSNFSNSWNMVSFPELSVGLTGQSLLPNTFKLRRFETASNAYTKGEITDIELLPGAGYWLKIDNSNNISGKNYESDFKDSIEVAVSKGWNILGNPFQSSLPLTNLEVKYKDGSIRSYADAIARKEVAGYVWSYEGSKKEYNFIAINPDRYKTTATKRTYVDPYRGFWAIIKSDQISAIIMNI